MHVSLTDALACPDCGPEWGLIVIARRTEERRLLDGYIGCPNCRREWALRDGYADFAQGTSDDVTLQAPSSESATLMGAALGITEGPGALLIVGSGASHGLMVSQMIEGIEVVCVAQGLAAEVETPGVSRVGAGEKLPFREGFARGAVISDEAALRHLEQVVRIVGVSARVLVMSGGAEVAARLERGGMHVLLREANVTVAQREA